MILSALKYTRHIGEPREWGIVGPQNNYAYFDNLNLLVGKNASGKSRTLNVIRQIASLLSSKIDLKNTVSSSEEYELIFNENGSRYKYILSFRNRVVSNEILTLNDKVLLDRSKDVLLDTNGVNVAFDVLDNELCVVLKDTENNPYFNDLVKWGNSLRNYLFANQFEKNHMVKDYTRIEGDDQNIDDPDVLLHTFYKGRELFGEKYISDIITGMAVLGYNISDIDIQETKGGYGICIEEEGEYLVSQLEMSQGMFRALSLFILLIYARMSDLSVCLLIDDMGEGLDFDSSKRMMDVFVKKVNKTNIQFFMTTNDRHVMNHISLCFWTVIDREAGKSIFYDYKNSKEIFEDFKYTGLNNFDFLATDFYRKGFGVIDDEDND